MKHEGGSYSAPAELVYGLVDALIRFPDTGFPVKTEEYRGGKRVSDWLMRKETPIFARILCFLACRRIQRIVIKISLNMRVYDLRIVSFVNSNIRVYK